MIRILNLTVNGNKYNQLRAGCCYKLPRDLLLKNATISVQSPDNACFAWAVVAALHPTERDTARPSSYPDYASVLNLEGIEFPMSLGQIGKFERQNDISINVYSFEVEMEKPKKGSTVFPLRLTNQKRDRHVNLLYTPNQEHGDVGHFVWIKNLSRLDKLASFLSTDQLKILRSKFETLSAEDFNLLTRKGVFPYEYLDCANKLQDPCLPPRESFYSSLTGETVSESDYAHAETV